VIKVKRHDITMTYKKRNPVAREVRTEKYKSQVIPDRHKERKENEKWKEMIDYLKSLS
jgi:transcriptional regulator of NAD metabolism